MTCLEHWVNFCTGAKFPILSPCLPFFSILSLLSPPLLPGSLRDDVVYLFVCLFVCSSVASAVSIGAGSNSKVEGHKLEKFSMCPSTFFVVPLHVGGHNKK